MAVITIAELLIVESEADQLSLSLLPSMTERRALITGGAVRRGEGASPRRGGGKERRTKTEQLNN